jgi:hypothetical protein
MVALIDELIREVGIALRGLELLSLPADLTATRSD